MGRKDLASKILVNITANFADVVNNTVFKGMKIVLPENIQDRETEEQFLELETNEQQAKRRDILKQMVVKTDQHATYFIIGIENQSEVDYTMAIRCLLYDALEYERQKRDLIAEFKAKQNELPKKQRYKLSSAENLTGLPKDTVFKPVITIVLYLGKEPWDASQDLYGMFGKDFPTDFFKYVNNWNINLVNPQTMSEAELDGYTSELGAVLKFIKYSRNEEALNKAVNNDSRYRNLSKEAVNMIKTFTNKRLKFVKTKRGGYDMCLALQQMEERAINFGINKGFSDGMEKGFSQGMEQGIEQGIEQGFSKGIEKHKYDVVNNMLLMNKFTKEDIATASGCTLEEVEAIANGTYILH